MLMNFLGGAALGTVIDQIIKAVGGAAVDAGTKVVKDKIENYGGKKSLIDERNYNAMRQDLKGLNNDSYALWEEFIASTADDTLFSGRFGKQWRSDWLSDLRVRFSAMRQERPVRDVKELNDKGKVAKIVPTPQADFVSLDVKVAEIAATYFGNEKQKHPSPGTPEAEARLLARDETLKQFVGWGLPHPSEFGKLGKAADAALGIPSKVNASLGDEAKWAEAVDHFKRARAGE